jgi:hypothetical protein
MRLTDLPRWRSTLQLVPLILVYLNKNQEYKSDPIHNRLTYPSHPRTCHFHWRGLVLELATLTDHMAYLSTQGESRSGWPACDNAIRWPWHVYSFTVWLLSTQIWMNVKASIFSTSVEHIPGVLQCLHLHLRISTAVCVLVDDLYDSRHSVHHNYSVIIYGCTMQSTWGRLIDLCQGRRKQILGGQARHW